MWLAESACCSGARRSWKVSAWWQVQSRKFENASGDAWEHFKHVYDRKYESDGEESLRYSYFQEKIEVAKQWREDNPSAVHGVNKFSDWSSVEIQERTFDL